jgi:hypothetical protein
MTKAARISCCSAYLVSLILCILAISPMHAFILIRSRAASQPNQQVLDHNDHRKRLTSLSMSTTSNQIADIEEINNFATENGIVLSFTTFGPGE